ncbi:RDD family protein [Actinospongicola halichondriae]|uniref:RDD family protein n=1 Tax=Actinospongicola halichondriae TaxID=3236844 RepID=UPI003D58D27F
MVAPTAHESRAAAPSGGIVTPEAVLLEFAEAGLGSRALAFLADLGVRLGLLWAVLFGFSLAAPALGETFVTVVLIASGFAVLLVYPVVCETMWNGKTVGKMLVGLRVITIEGAPVRFRHAAIRSALGLVDFVLGFGSVAVLASLTTRQSQRLGDIAAGTIVIRERQAGAYAQPIIFQPPYGWNAYVAGLDVSALRDEEYVLVRTFLLRVHEMRMQPRDERARELAAWIADRLRVEVPAQHPAETFLVAIAAAYQARHVPSASGPDVWANTFLPPGAIPPPVWQDDPLSSTWGIRPGTWGTTPGSS